MGTKQSNAFQQLKSYIAGKLLVTVPDPEAPLLLYAVASDHAVSGVLVQGRRVEAHSTASLIYLRSSIRS